MNKTLKQWICLAFSVLLVSLAVSAVSEDTDEAQVWTAIAEEALRKEDLETAFNYYELAANAGDVKAQFILAGFCFYGMGTERSFEKAMEYLQMAADQGEQNDFIELRNAIATAGSHEETVELDIAALRNEGNFWRSDNNMAVWDSFNGYCAYAPIPVSVGEQYTVSIYRMSSTHQHAVLLVDESMTVLDSYGESNGTDGKGTYSFTVPSGATKMLLTTATDKAAPTVTKSMIVGTLTGAPALSGQAEEPKVSDSQIGQAEEAKGSDSQGTRMNVIDKEIDNITDDIDDINAAIGYTEDETEEQLDISSLKYEDHFWNSQTDLAEQNEFPNYCLYNAIDVAMGEKYRISIWQMNSSKQHPVLLTDDSLTIKERYKDTKKADGLVSFEFVVPAGVTKMLLTTQNENIPVITKIVKGGVLNSVPALIGRVDKVLAGKTVAIIGDSISTNGNPGSGDGTNAVELTVTAEDVGVELSAYLTNNDVRTGLSLGGHTFTSEEVGTEVTFTPVEEDIGKVIGRSVNYYPNSTTVWWEVMQEALGNTTIPVCWSGASVTSHEGEKSSFATSYAWHDAQIRKCGIRIPGTMERTAPDVIIIYRGTNDFSHSPYTKLTAGYFDSFDWQYPESDTAADGYGFIEGLCLTVKKLREAYPSAKIFLCTLNVFKRINYSHFPTNNGTNSLPQYNAAIREVADFLGCGLIDFEKDGITFENCYSEGYITDSARTPTHPSEKGHLVMGNKAIADIRAQYGAME